ncbi:Protein MEMO1 [Taenia crassiceps]|uniref:Protein MEMO1 n=1 Tax=Taenia crassiceps TaxID=6207 RepID=A0ABR4QTX6_9CEST
MAEKCFEESALVCHRKRAPTHDAHMYKENHLYSEVSGLMQLTVGQPSDEIRTIIVPKRIFVITLHKRPVENKFLLSSCDCLITLNYNIPVDKDISHELWKTGGCEYISRLEDEKNSGVEIQLPFITKIMEEYDYFINHTFSQLQG